MIAGEIQVKHVAGKRNNRTDNDIHIFHLSDYEIPVVIKLYETSVGRSRIRAGPGLRSRAYAPVLSESALFTVLRVDQGDQVGKARAERPPVFPEAGCPERRGHAKQYGEGLRENAAVP